MGKIEHIQSRYGDTRIIEEIDDVTLKVSGQSNYIRESVNNDRIMSIDFEGGPFIQVGGRIANYIITEILPDPDKKEGLASYILKGNYYE